MASHIDGPPVEPQAAGLVGTTIGDRYRLTRRLGAGGMGTVYVAEHVFTGMRVALKLIHAPVAPRIAKRMKREAMAPSIVGHPAIATVHDAGVDTGTGLLYIAQELLVGESLRDLLTRSARIGPDDLIAKLLPVLDGLHAAHRAGLVHRDVKPEHVFFLSDRRACASKLIDFGIVKWMVAEAAGEDRLTGTGQTVGTPYYMAPEQIMASSTVGPATDVWAMGVVLYESLVGRPPFTASTALGVVSAVLCADAPPEIPSVVSGPIAAVMRRALEPDVSRRWPSIAAMRDALRRAAPSRLDFDDRPTGFVNESVVAAAAALATARDESATTTFVAPTAVDAVALAVTERDISVVAPVTLVRERASVRHRRRRFSPLVGAAACVAALLLASVVKMTRGHADSSRQDVSRHDASPVASQAVASAKPAAVTSKYPLQHADAVVPAAGNAAASPPPAAARVVPRVRQVVPVATRVPLRRSLDPRAAPDPGRDLIDPWDSPYRGSPRRASR